MFILENYNLLCKLVFLMKFKIFLVGEWLKMSLRLLYKQHCCRVCVQLVCVWEVSVVQVWASINTGNHLTQSTSELTVSHHQPVSTLHSRQVTQNNSQPHYVPGHPLTTSLSCYQTRRCWYDCIVEMATPTYQQHRENKHTVLPEPHSAGPHGHTLLAHTATLCWPT